MKRIHALRARWERIVRIHGQAGFRAFTHAGSTLNASKTVDGPLTFLLHDADGRSRAALFADAAKNARVNIVEDFPLE